MKKQDEQINHEGVVTDIRENMLTVEIISRSACASCHAKGFCSLGDMKVKSIEVEDAHASFYEVGERVNIKLRKSLGYRALWISYINPLIILMFLLLFLSSIGCSEPKMGLAVIVALIIYYFLVWLFKDKFKRDFTFTIEKL